MQIERVKCAECETLRLLRRLEMPEVEHLLATWEDMPDLPEGWLTMAYWCDACQKIMLRAEIACDVPMSIREKFTPKGGKK